MPGYRAVILLVIAPESPILDWTASSSLEKEFPCHPHFRFQLLYLFEFVTDFFRMEETLIAEVVQDLTN
eukprot:1156732-Pelagomonas_calceolata.AAC.4